MQKVCVHMHFRVYASALCGSTKKVRRVCDMSARAMGFSSAIVIAGHVVYVVGQ